MVQVAGSVGLVLRGGAGGQAGHGDGAAGGFDAGGEHGEGHAAGVEVVFELGHASGGEFFLIGQAQAIFAVQVPGGAGVGAADGDLFDALVLGRDARGGGLQRDLGHAVTGKAFPG